MKEKEQGKFGYGFNIGATAGSAVLGAAPLSIIFVVSLICGLIGFATMFIAHLVKMLTKVFVKRCRN